MEDTKLIKKIKEYLDADIKDNNDLDAQAYAEQLMFWIENWEEQKWLNILFMITINTNYSI